MSFRLKVVYSTSPQEIEKQKKLIIDIEQRLLETIGFNFHYVQPHKFLIKFAKKINVSKETARLAWSILENSYKCPLSVQFPPHIIASACLLIANCQLETTQLSLKDLELPSVSLEVFEDVCKQILELYTKAQIQLDGKPYFSAAEPRIDALFSKMSNKRTLSESDLGGGRKRKVSNGGD